ncbi:hypothetical protein OY671_001093 [Metschnikowia pulcherrima]|nr:hypothetical protein OY671_001093 [Metschnikowia pulcherrima]
MDQENDALGLDQPLKLGRVLKIPKITDDLLFENNRGLPQIRNNYPKLSKAIRRNDAKCAERVSKQRLSKSAAHQAKVATEVDNLQKVLSFYQLWCHGLFPRATFKDCLRILRNHKSSPLKEYRRGLINNEIRRLKIEKGIIVEEPENGEPENEDPDDNEGLYAPANIENGEGRNDPGAQQQSMDNSNTADSDDEDWGFLSTNRSRRNGLFIGEDEDDDQVDDSAPTHAEPAGQRREDATAETDDFPGDDDFDEPFISAQEKENVPEEDYDEELAIMREMGM